jgi:diguanylate cyclase (GGDEF)-like protein
MDRIFLSADRRTLVALALLGNVVPVGIATASNWSSHRLPFFVGAAGVCVVPVLVTALPVRFVLLRRLAAFVGIPMLTLMQAYTGGSASGYAVLMMMAMVWFGLQATDREIVAMVALLAACSYLPMLTVGAPAFPVHWGNATLLLLIGSTVAGTLRFAMREAARLTERLRREAAIDPLTGLLNRRGWERAAGAELERARRTNWPISFVLIDLDEFKQLNDARGHDEGDRTLRETAERIRTTLRTIDISARIGGDEFVILLPDSTPEGAVAAVERLREITLLATFSAGVALWEPDEGLEELVRRADLALYAAKTSGGNRTELAPRQLAFDALTSPGEPAACP